MSATVIWEATGPPENKSPDGGEAIRAKAQVGGEQLSPKDTLAWRSAATAKRS